MFQAYVMIFGSMILVACPIFIPVVAVICFVFYTYKPDLFQKAIQWLIPPRRLKTAQTQTSEDKGFTTYEEQQEKNVKQYVNPDWNPHAPENKEMTNKIHNIIERNRKLNEEELRREELQEQRAKN